MNLYDKDGNRLDLKSLKDMSNLAVYPGSFNPLHVGHKGIYDLLSNDGFHVIFEMSKSRYQKEPYTDEEVNQTISQFKGYSEILVSNAPLFMDKREQLSGFNPSWVMGYDTAKRWIYENRFVDQEEQKKIDTMKVIFVGRLVDGVYSDPRDLLEGTEKFKCTIYDFRCDISSTQIRNGLR